MTAARVLDTPLVTDDAPRPKPAGQWITRVCPTCEQSFTRKIYPSERSPRLHCSRACWLKRHNNPERNAAVARATSEKRAATIRKRGDASGKWYRKVNGKHEHRAVAEQLLGRPLLPSEIVHHENEAKRDNNGDNLMVTTRREHIEIHRSLMVQRNRARNAAPDQMICNGCGELFWLSATQRYHWNKGQKRFYCGRYCAINY